MAVAGSGVGITSSAGSRAQPAVPSRMVTNLRPGLASPLHPPPEAPPVREAAQVAQARGCVSASSPVSVSSAPPSSRGEPEPLTPCAPPAGRGARKEAWQGRVCGSKSPLQQPTQRAGARREQATRPGEAGRVHTRPGQRVYSTCQARPGQVLAAEARVWGRLHASLPLARGQDYSQSWWGTTARLSPPWAMPKRGVHD